MATFRLHDLLAVYVLFQQLCLPIVSAFSKDSSRLQTVLKVSADTCRYLPGDEGWPFKSEWEELNSTVNGQLITTLPVGHVCHDPTYDETACEALQHQWSVPEVM